MLRIEEARRWRAIRWIHRRRPLLTAILVLAAPAACLLTGERPYNLLTPSSSPRFVVPWVLVVVGVIVRAWGSGNLRKNQEITNTGVYRLVRHPLYFGNLAFLLAFFLTVGDPRIGLVLFALLIAFVYYPTMLSEEQYLATKFPPTPAYRPPPRLIPDLRRMPEALRSDRFEVGVAHRNLGFRAGWFILGLPLFLRLFDWLLARYFG